MNLPQDHTAREQAIDITQSFAVSAPAGSGKTGLLTLRVLKLLSVVNSPEEILCITFTNKAAQEMRDRVLTAILAAKIEYGSKKANKVEPFKQQLHDLALAAYENSVTKGWELENTPHRLKITTIDSFCKSITQHLPILSQMGFNSSITPSPKEIYRSAVRAYVLESLNASNASLAKLIHHLDGNLFRLEDLLIQLLYNRDQWLPIIFEAKENSKAHYENALTDWFKEIIGNIAPLLTRYETEMCDLFQYASSNLKEAGIESFIIDLGELKQFPKEESLLGFRYWALIAQFFLTKDGGLRKTFNKNSGFPALKDCNDKDRAKAVKAVLAEILEYFSHIKELPLYLHQVSIIPYELLSESQWALLATLLDELPKLAAYLKITFQEENTVDFIEVAQTAHHALKGHDEVFDIALKLDYKINHILIDEFQDTSYPQLQLIQELTKEWLPDEHRTFYMVGDGMQSCYGFRNANVGIFLSVREFGLPNVELTPLDLTVNFRSTPYIIEWVNRVFLEAFPKANDMARGAVCYTPSNTFTDKEDESNSYVTCIGFVSASSDEKHQQTQYIAEKINVLRHEHPKQSIAILGRSRAVLKSVIEVLAKEGIPYQAIDMDPLSSKPVIKDLTILTRAIINIDDRIAWLGLLRGPWCALSWKTLNDIANYSILEKPKTTNNIWQVIDCAHKLDTVTDDEKTKLSNIRTLFTQIFRTLGTQPLAMIVESAWINLGGNLLLTNESEMKDIEVFFDLIAECEEQGTIDNWQDFQAKLDTLYAKPLDAGDNPVQLMTMHKSKGLEFDTVFLPSLERSPRGDESQLIQWHERVDNSGRATTLISPISSAHDALPDPLTKFIRFEKSIKNRLEDLRLLYVACTRARSRLFILANLTKTKKGEIATPSKSSLLSSIWPSIQDEVELIESNDSIIKATTESPRKGNQLLSFHSDWYANNHRLLTERFQHDVDFNNTREDIENVFNEARKLRSARGTFIHKLLMNVCLHGFKHYHATKFDELSPFLKADLAELNISGADQETMLNEAKQLLKQLSEDSTARWVLDNSHNDSHCEFEVYHPKLGQLIIDRTFVDQEGSRWIIDYKTSAPALNQPLNAFVQQEVSEYSAQLARYEKVFSESNINTALYFPFINHLAQFHLDQ